MHRISAIHGKLCITAWAWGAER